MALMLVSFLLAIEKGTNEKKTSVKWLVLCIICFFLQGGIGIMQKIHQTSPHKAELNAFLVIAFAVAFLISVGKEIMFRYY